MKETSQNEIYAQNHLVHWVLVFCSMIFGGFSTIARVQSMKLSAQVVVGKGVYLDEYQSEANCEIYTFMKS